MFIPGALLETMGRGQRKFPGIVQFSVWWTRRCTEGCAGMWENTKATDSAWLGRVALPRRQNLAEIP